MRKTTWFSAVLFIAIALASAYAHPPSDIKLNFDTQTKALQVVVTHNTSNPLSHYVKRLGIFLNGDEVIEQNISRQDNNVTQTLSYILPDAKSGDFIFVEAVCSKSGKLERRMEIK